MATLTHSVAVVGGTGGLGKHISLAFLTHFKAHFHTVRILTRDPSSAAATELAGKGAELHKLDEADLPRALDGAFKGVDVIVNALTSLIPDETKRAVVEAAARSDVKVFFLSEFGADHRNNDPDYDHPEWINKREYAVETRKQLKGRKVIAVYPSAFLEFGLSPFVGVDIKNNVYSCYGPPSQRFSTTATPDIGLAVARLAVLALDPATASSVPDDVRIAGSAASYEEIRDLVARVKGVPKGEIKSEDLGQVKQRIRQESKKDFLLYIRVLVADGKMDYSQDNSNELVNPGETLWKWKTIEDYVRESPDPEGFNVPPPTDAQK